MRGLFILLALAFMPPSVHAQGLDALSITTQGDGSQTYTLTLQVLLLMTALTMLPALLLAMTSFTRIIIVLAILRQALGTAQTPSNQILVALALFMTFFIMSPVADKVYADAVEALSRREDRRQHRTRPRRRAGARLARCSSRPRSWTSPCSPRCPVMKLSRTRTRCRSRSSRHHSSPAN